MTHSEEIAGVNTPVDPAQDDTFLRGIEAQQVVVDVLKDEERTGQSRRWTSFCAVWGLDILERC